MDRISKFGLQNHGIVNAREECWNLDASPLYEATIRGGLGRMSAGGAAWGSTCPTSIFSATGSGRVTVKVVPSPVWLAMEREPPRLTP